MCPSPCTSCRIRAYGSLVSAAAGAARTAASAAVRAAARRRIARPWYDGAVDLELRGRVALVTGASRGIGRAIAGRLAAEGAVLGLGARDPDALEAAAAELRAGAGARIHAAPVDVTDGAALAPWVEGAAGGL